MFSFTITGNLGYTKLSIDGDRFCLTTHMKGEEPKVETAPDGPALLELLKASCEKDIADELYCSHLALLEAHRQMKVLSADYGSYGLTPEEVTSWPRWS